MALTSWQSFKFFDASEVSLSDTGVANALSQGDVSCLCSGADNLFLGDSNGHVRILSRTFSVIRSFKAHETGSIRYMKQVEGTSLLLTVSEDLSSEPELKVWALDKTEKKTGTPRCQSTLTVQNGRRPFPISAFAALDDLSQLAFGFANGSVTVVRGDLIHDRGTKQRTVFESEEPITGIQFREGKTSALYIATTGRILTLIISGRGQGQPARTLDDTGCAVGCMAVDNETRDIIVARNDAIYYYGLHGRGSVYNCDGHKSILTTHKNYVALAVPSSTSSIAKSLLGGSNDPNQTTTLMILNTDLHFIAHIYSLKGQIDTCFTEWGDLFAFTTDGRLFRYHERPLESRLDTLAARDMFNLAIEIAQKSGADTKLLNGIYRRYGDHFMQKKDFDTAMQQYLRAIQHTEPSQIIRQFLGPQRIHNLVDYLEELHEQRKANPDHTMLLLNCYAKLQDVDKLESFIKSPDDIKFDLDTAISMCRQAGYFDQAAYLARKHYEHSLVVSILVEDSHKYAEALAYIWRLEPELAYSNFSKYATVLLEHCPKDATQIFVDYYTGSYKAKKDAVVVTTSSTTAQAQPSSLVPSAVQNLAALLPLPYMSMKSQERPSSPGKKSQTHIVESVDDEPPLHYNVPKPRSTFSAFIDHPDEFIIFLEACLRTESLSLEDKTDLYTTLFEMYVRKAKGKDGAEKLQWENRARQLIEDEEIPMDPSNVLLLSDLAPFRDGSILIRETQGLRFDIFRSYISAKDSKGAVNALHKYGPEDPQLYPAALAYFTSSETVLDEVGEDEVQTVLEKIDKDGLMAPLQVIQTLSGSKVANIGLVKRYLRDTISRERSEIANNRRTIDTFRNDTAQKRADLAALTTQPMTFNASRCSTCGGGLEQPTVHFMCKHSFHQRCLNTETIPVEHVECPLCAPNNAMIRQIRQGQLANRERHDTFKSELERSADRFGTIADWYGRGVMSGVTLEDSKRL